MYLHKLKIFFHAAETTKFPTIITSLYLLIVLYLPIALKTIKMFHKSIFTLFLSSIGRHGLQAKLCHLRHREDHLVLLLL